MNKVSRPLIFTLVAILVLAIIGSILASGPFHSDSHGGPSLMFFDEDLSDSALGWMIAIPILVIVGMVVTAVLAGVALITVVALAFAAVMVVLALLLAFTPFVIFLGLPILAIYGLVKLFQRDQPKATPAV